MADPADDGQERSEQPSQKRLDDARRKGEVARSRELTTSVLLLSAAAALLALGPYMIHRLAALMRTSLTMTPHAGGLDRWLPGALAAGLEQGVSLLAPLLGLTLVAALVAPLLLGGWSWSSEALTLKWERLDPVKGIGRMFSVRALVELVKAMAKFAVVLGVTALLLWSRMREMLGTVHEDTLAGMHHVTALIGSGFLLLCCSTVLIAGVDVPFQLWNYKKQLRMTKQELRDEARDTEGKPEVRSKVRQLQQELARGRMMEAVPQADVVVTNPTHYSVALAWDAATMRAPRVIATGAGPIALRIREVAADHAVPVLPSPPLARAIYHSTDLGDEIPAGLYLAVAAVLAWVFRVREGGHGGAVPPRPEDLPIPEELRR